MQNCVKKCNIVANQISDGASQLKQDAIAFHLYEISKVFQLSVDGMP